MLTKTDIEKYFIAEKQESLLFIIVGLLAILIPIICNILFDTRAWKGAAIPLIAIGLIQVVVGYTVYNRSDKDRMRVVYNYDLDPSAIKEKEIPRMKIVNKNFVVYRYVEITLAFLGLILFFYNRVFIGIKSLEEFRNSFIMGFGIALFVQAIIMLSADYFAEKRAQIYTTKLETYFRKKNAN